jgi:acylphosphatase
MGAGADSESARLHAVVSGVVQGVSFRYYTQRRAAQLGLAGWVRNLRNGSVEVLAEGRRAALERLVDFLRVGPPSSAVADVQLAWETYTGEYATFEVRHV